MEEQVGHDLLGARLGVELGVEALDEAFVHRAVATHAVEAGGGEPVGGGEPALPVGGLGERWAQPQDPELVAVLLVEADAEAGRRRAPGVGPDGRGAPDAVAAVCPIHEVHEVVARRQRGAGGHEVVRGAAQDAPAGAHLDERADGTALLDDRDGARVDLTVAAGAEHGVADGDLLDGDLAVRGAHERAGRQALVGVTHDEDVAVAGAEQADELVLDAVGVLVLVDEHVPEAPLVVLEHVGVGVEQLDGVGEQVVEVHRPGGAQPRLVLAVDLGDAQLEGLLGAGRVRVGAEAVVLGGRDLGVDRAGREALGVEVQLAQHVGDQAHRVGLVVDGEAGRGTRGGRRRAAGCARTPSGTWRPTSSRRRARPARPRGASSPARPCW